MGLIYSNDSMRWLRSIHIHHNKMSWVSLQGKGYRHDTSCVHNQQLCLDKLPESRELGYHCNPLTLGSWKRMIEDDDTYDMFSYVCHIFYDTGAKYMCRRLIQNKNNNIWYYAICIHRLYVLSLCPACLLLLSFYHLIFEHSEISQSSEEHNNYICFWRSLAISMTYMVS